MIKYEVIEFVEGDWKCSRGEFDRLHDAIERKLVLDVQEDNSSNHFEIIVKLDEEHNKGE